MDYYKMCQRFGLDSVPSPDGRFTIDELIGEGTYGEVFKAKDTVTGNNMICYIMLRNKDVVHTAALPMVTKVCSNSIFFVLGEFVAIKILEDIAGNEEEIEDEYLALRDLSLHPNIPSFHGIYFVKSSKQLNDQLWFVMEVHIIFYN